MFYLGRYEKTELTLEGKCRNHKGRQIEDYKVLKCNSLTSCWTSHTCRISKVSSVKTSDFNHTGKSEN